MLRPTHILYAGSVAFPHRGEFVYVHNDAFPSEAERNRWRLALQLRFLFEMGAARLGLVSPPPL